MPSAAEIMAAMRRKASVGDLGDGEVAERAQGRVEADEAAAAPLDAPARDWTEEERELIAWVEAWEPPPFDEFATVPVMVTDWLTKKETRDRITPVLFRVPPDRLRQGYGAIWEVSDAPRLKERILALIAQGPRLALRWTCMVRIMREMTPEEFRLTGQDRIPLSLQERGTYRIPDGA